MSGSYTSTPPWHGAKLGTVGKVTARWRYENAVEPWNFFLWPQYRRHQCLCLESPAFLAEGAEFMELTWLSNAARGLVKHFSNIVHNLR